MCELSFQKTWHLRNAYNDNQPVKVCGVNQAALLAAVISTRVQGIPELDKQLQPSFRPLLTRLTYWYLYTSWSGDQIRA